MGALPFVQVRSIIMTKRFLKHLAVLPFDKCQHRMLIELPKLYELKYVEDFSELADPAHFEQVMSSI